MRFTTHHTISEHIAATAEGFLVCMAVPIARTGKLTYGDGESPIRPGKDGVAHVDRPEAEVFAAEAIASFEGKPVTINHPAEDVTPANWRTLAVGHAQDVVRGAGEASDLLLANLIITDEQAIKLIRGGLREISCGYDADYEQVAPGRGRQHNIRGNHIALVHRGRCGSRCRINDSEDKMTKKQTVADKIAALFKSPEGRKVLDSLDNPTPEKKEETTDAPDTLETLATRLNELEIQVRNLVKTANAAQGEEKKEKPAEAQDEEQPAQPDAPKKEKTADAAYKARTVDADTKSRAGLLVPGMVVHDTDQLCAVQRTALRTASARDAAVDAVVAGALRGTTLDSCDCVTLDAAFVAASEVARAGNNGRTVDMLTTASARDFGSPTTPAQINKLNADYHSKKGA